MGVILDFKNWKKIHEAEEAEMAASTGKPIDPGTLKSKLLAVQNDTDYYSVKKELGNVSIKQILAKLADLSDEDRNAIASNLLLKTSTNLATQLRPALDEFKEPSFSEKVGNWMFGDEKKTVNTTGDFSF
jgi:hypothetical protein